MTDPLEPSASLSHPDYTLVFDGGSRGNPGPGYGSYLIIDSEHGRRELKQVHFRNPVTNNEAEYGTLLAGLLEVYRRVTAAGRNPRESSVRVLGDSALVINQLNGRWKIRNPRMQELNRTATNALLEFRTWRAVLQPREESVRLLGH